MSSSSLSAFASGSEDSNNNPNDENDRFWAKYAAWRTAPAEEEKKEEVGGEGKDENFHSEEYKINFQSSSSSSSSSSRLMRKRIASATTTARGGGKGASVTAKPSMEAAEEEDATNELMMEKIAQVYDDLLLQNTLENRQYTGRMIQQMSMDDPINRDISTDSPTPSPSPSPVNPSSPTINEDDNGTPAGTPTNSGNNDGTPTNTNNGGGGGSGTPGGGGGSNFLKDLCVTPASGLYGEVSDRAGILEYAYAVEIATGTVPNDVITPMEQKMNDGLLDDFFTDACGEKDEDGNISMQRSSNIFRLRSDGLTGLTSQPPDVLLDQECPGSASDLDTPGVECVLIYGKMTLYLKENTDAVIREAHAYQTLQEKMNSGYFNAAHPAIIGTKMVDLDTIANLAMEEVEDTPDTDNVETIGGDDNANKGLIYGIVGGSVGLILLLAIVSLRRRKQRQTQRALDLDEEDQAYLQQQQSYPPILDDVVRSSSSSPDSVYLHSTQSQGSAYEEPSYDPEDVPIFKDEELP